MRLSYSRAIDSLRSKARLEISQNALHINWSAKEVDQRLQSIMKEIHDKCEKYGNGENGVTDYSKGANIAGFIKLADATLSYGPV